LSFLSIPPTSDRQPRTYSIRLRRLTRRQQRTLWIIQKQSVIFVCRLRQQPFKATVAQIWARHRLDDVGDQGARLLRAGQGHKRTFSVSAVNRAFDNTASSRCGGKRDVLLKSHRKSLDPISRVSHFTPGARRVGSGTAPPFARQTTYWKCWWAREVRTSKPANGRTKGKTGRVIPAGPTRREEPWLSLALYAWPA
jgi:hypothetical protein